MQQRKHISIGTTRLTRSFGWDSAEAFEQHDVQEFCRVLFERIDDSCDKKNKFIESLYEGEMIDYVMCRECHNVSKRTDKFMDISLTIKNEFDNIHNKSLVEALKNYLQPEVLSGSNQYSCEKCSKKVDAQKGLKFEKLPPLLTLQLKRFDLDYTTFMRRKIDDRVAFPPVLDLNAFCLPDLAPDDPKVLQLLTSTSSFEGLSEEEDDISGKLEGTVDGNEVDDSNNNYFSNKPNYYYSNSASPQDIQYVEKHFIDDNRVRKIAARLLQNGPYVYELFAILVHSGSAFGGHYYCYVKDLSTPRAWHTYNDSSVSSCPASNIARAFGGKGMANAYMLMYRQVDKQSLDGNVMFPLDVPTSFSTAMLKQAEEEEKKEKERQKRMQTVVIQMGIFVHEKNKDFVEYIIQKNGGVLINNDNAEAIVEAPNSNVLNSAANQFLHTETDSNLTKSLKDIFAPANIPVGSKLAQITFSFEINEEKSVISLFRRIAKILNIAPPLSHDEEIVQNDDFENEMNRTEQQESSNCAPDVNMDEHNLNSEEIKSRMLYSLLSPLYPPQVLSLLLQEVQDQPFDSWFDYKSCMRLLTKPSMSRSDYNHSSRGLFCYSLNKERNNFDCVGEDGDLIIPESENEEFMEYEKQSDSYLHLYQNEFENFRKDIRNSNPSNRKALELKMSHGPVFFKEKLKIFRARFNQDANQSLKMNASRMSGYSNVDRYTSSPYEYNNMRNENKSDSFVLSLVPPTWVMNEGTQDEFGSAGYVHETSEERFPPECKLQEIKFRMFMPEHACFSDEFILRIPQQSTHTDIRTILALQMGFNINEAPAASSKLEIAAVPSVPHKISMDRINNHSEAFTWLNYSFLCGFLPSDLDYSNYIDESADDEFPDWTRIPFLVEVAKFSIWRTFSFNRLPYSIEPLKRYNDHNENQSNVNSYNCKQFVSIKQSSSLLDLFAEVASIVFLPEEVSEDNTEATVNNLKLAIRANPSQFPILIETDETQPQFINLNNLIYQENNQFVESLRSDKLKVSWSSPIPHFGHSNMFVKQLKAYVYRHPGVSLGIDLNIESANSLKDFSDRVSKFNDMQQSNGNQDDVLSSSYLSSHLSSHNDNNNNINNLEISSGSITPSPTPGFGEISINPLSNNFASRIPCKDELDGIFFHGQTLPATVFKTINKERLNLDTKDSRTAFSLIRTTPGSNISEVKTVFLNVMINLESAQEKLLSVSDDFRKNMPSSLPSIRQLLGQSAEGLTEDAVCLPYNNQTKRFTSRHLLAKDFFVFLIADLSLRVKRMGEETAGERLVKITRATSWKDIQPDDLDFFSVNSTCYIKPPPQSVPLHCLDSLTESSEWNTKSTNLYFYLRDPVYMPGMRVDVEPVISGLLESQEREISSFVDEQSFDPCNNQEDATKRSRPGNDDEHEDRNRCQQDDYNVNSDLILENPNNMAKDEEQHSNNSVDNKDSSYCPPDSIMRSFTNNRQPSAILHRKSPIFVWVRLFDQRASKLYSLRPVLLHDTSNDQQILEDICTKFNFDMDDNNAPQLTDCKSALANFSTSYSNLLVPLFSSVPSGDKDAVIYHSGLHSIARIFTDKNSRWNSEDKFFMVVVNVIHPLYDDAHSRDQLGRSEIFGRRVGFSIDSIYRALDSSSNSRSTEKNMDSNHYASYRNRYGREKGVQIKKKVQPRAEAKC